MSALKAPDVTADVLDYGTVLVSEAAIADDIVGGRLGIGILDRRSSERTARLSETAAHCLRELGITPGVPYYDLVIKQLQERVVLYAAAGRAVLESLSAANVPAGFYVEHGHISRADTGEQELVITNTVVMSNGNCITFAAGPSFLFEACQMSELAAAGYVPDTLTVLK